MKKETSDTIMWLIGVVVFSTGCALMWGWPASLLSVGSIMAFWPLLKQFKN